MQYTISRLTWIVLLVLALSSSLFSQSSSPKPPLADDAVLRAVEDFFAAYEKKDLQGFMQLWSTKSPEFATRQKEIQELFATTEKIEIHGLTVRKATAEGEKTKVRVVVEVNAVEANSRKPKTGFGKLNRTLYFVKEDGGQKVWREVAAEEDLAAELVEAKTPDERTVLLTADKDLITIELRQALSRRGNRLRLQGDYAQALVAHQLAQAIAEQLGDIAGIGSAVGSIGYINRTQGNYRMALEYFHKALALREPLEDKRAVAYLLINIGIVNYYQGNYQTALEYFQKSLALAEATADKEVIAETLNQIGYVHLEQGDSIVAMEYYQRTLTLREAMGDRAGVAHVLNDIGVVYRFQGNYGLAMDAFQRSLKLRGTWGAKDGIAYVLRNIGYVHLLRGNYILAMEYYQKCLTLREALGDKWGIAISLLDIGILNRTQGNYSIASDYFQRSFQLAELVGAKSVTASTLDQIGYVHFLQGNKVLALEYLQKSLKLKEVLGEKRGIADLLHSIGDVEYAQGNNGRALDYYRRSLTFREAAGEKTEISSSLLAIGNIHYSQANYREGLEFVRRSAAIARQIGSRETLWRAHTKMGTIYQALNQHDQAGQAFREAIAVIEDLRAQVAGGEQAQQRFFEDKVSPYHELVKLLIAESNLSEALAYAERAKARVLTDVLQTGRINVTKAMTVQEREQEERINDELASLNIQISHENQRHKPDQTRLANLKIRLDKTRLDHEALQSSLYAAHPELKVHRGNLKMIRIDEAAALFPEPRSALLEFVVTEEKTYLFVLTQEQEAREARFNSQIRGTPLQPSVTLKAYVLNISSTELAERVRHFRDLMARRDGRFQQPSRDLYDLLLKPAQAQLGGLQALVIVPDASLWELPFQALQTRQNHYLVEKYAISYAPSWTVLHEMTKVRKKEKLSAPEATTLLAFGNPQVGKQTAARVQSVLMDEKLEPLPEAERLVRTLGQLYSSGQSKIYIGSEAREEFVKSEAGKTRILQLATHGILNDASPMYSHVVLAQIDGNPHEDGLLEAWEIMKLDLKADLVVLSACETARGRIGAGEGVIGLMWALFVAGTPTTVVSQWKVESASTTELMLKFHRNLQPKIKHRKSSASTAEALQAAAKSILRHSQYRHPFYWAGFVLVGDGR